MSYELLKLEHMGGKGLNTDQQPWALPAEFITRGNNFRVSTGSISNGGGSQLWSISPVDFTPAHLMHVGEEAGDFWMIAGLTAIYVFDGTTWTDVSSAAGYGSLSPGDELFWSSCKMGRIPIFSNPQGAPEYWDPQQVATIMKPLPFDQTNDWVAKGFTANVFRSHRNFMFALNVTEGGINYPDTYRWSHPADPNAIPVTWDETDESFLAGRASLGGDGGAIIDGKSLRDAFCIYSENAINVLDYTGDEFVWRRRELSSTVGSLATDTLIEVKGVHYFLADGDIIRNDGNKIYSIAYNRIRRELTARLSVDHYQNSFAVRNDIFKEIWFCIPVENEVRPSIAYIYNWRDDSWVVRDLPAGISHADYGPQTITPKNWNDLPDSETWANQGQPWSAGGGAFVKDTIVGVSPDTFSLHFMDPLSNPDSPVNTVLERTDFPLIDSRQVTSITNVYPLMTGTEPVLFEFGSQEFPGGPVRWKPGVIFDPSEERKIDVRTTGPLHTWRISSINGGSWRIQGMNIEYSIGGLR